MSVWTIGGYVIEEAVCATSAEVELLPLDLNTDIITAANVFHNVRAQRARVPSKHSSSEAAKLNTVLSRCCTATGGAPA